MTQLFTEQDTPVIAKTKELCETLLQQDSFKELKAKLDAFASDSEAQSLYQSVSEKQSRLMSKQQQGQGLTEDEIKDFEDDRERLLMHPVAGGFIEAQEQFSDFRDTVVNYVTRTFELGRVPTADEAAPKKGCCGGGCGGGGCSTDGGGCS